MVSGHDGPSVHGQPAERVEYTAGVRFPHVRRGPAMLACLGALLPAIGEAAAPPGSAPATAVEEAPDGRTGRDFDAAQRRLQIHELRIVGREQVSLRQINRILAAERLEKGAEIFWPEDPKIERAQERLRATGYFKQVILRLIPLEDDEDSVILVLDLAERGTVTVQEVYLGSSRFTPFRGGLAIAERNFLGRGVQVGGSLIWGSLPRIERARRQQAYRLFFEAPRLGRAPLGLLGAAYIVSASEPVRVAGAQNDPDPSLFRALDYSRIGGVLGLTFPVLPDLTLGVDYRFERVDVFGMLPDNAVLYDTRPGVHRLTTAHFGLSWDEREQAFLAGKGGRVAFDLQLSSPALGSEYEYIKVVAAGAYSFRLPWRHWLTPQLSGGQIAGRAPLFELFYSGDLSEWTPGREQGLRYSTRNPIDVFGTGIDTRTFGVIFGKVDLEYVWPLFRRSRTRALYGGDLYLSVGIFAFAEDRANRRRRREAGEMVAPIGFNADLGLRLDTAIGTIGISVGNLLRRTPL